METSAEQPPPAARDEGPLGASWLGPRRREQERALPPGRVVVSCPAPLGTGGLGRHLEEILDALARAGAEPRSISKTTREQAPGRVVGVPELLARLAPLTRFSPAGRMWIESVGFDAYAARELGRAEHLIAFNGTAAAQFRAARRESFQSVGLMSANSHMRHVVRQHARAHRQYPVEPQWATRLVGRNVREYAGADRIYVASRYIADSFAAEGFPEESMSFFPLTPDPRYTPAARARDSSTFDVVYVGSLLVHKGVPLLLEAFSRLAHEQLRLTLVGGWKTRSMRRFVEGACARDPRVTVRPGDPLPVLRSARLCVHPAYEDGFAYAPAEALACGVPVLVSEDTGMKELIADDRDGLVLPTGDVDALTQAINAAYRGEILHGR